MGRARKHPHGRLADIRPTMLEELRGNHEKNYAEAAVRGQPAHTFLKPDDLADALSAGDGSQELCRPGSN